MNQFIVVGRLLKEVTLEREGCKYIAKITVAVPRSFKNSEGIYETDFIDCVLHGSVAQNTSEYCRKGDVIAVKGKIQTENEDDGDGHYTKRIIFMAEKITFLSSKNTEINNA